MRARRKAASVVNYADVEAGGGSTPAFEAEVERVRRAIARRPVSARPVSRVPGAQLTLRWAQASGFKAPVVATDAAAAGVRAPDEDDADAEFLARRIGPDTVAPILEVATQRQTREWRMSDFADYMSSPGDRDRVLAVTALEVSDTALGRLLRAPTLARELDWVARAWPAAKTAAGVFPRHRLLCHMAARGAWVDFRVAPGGASLWHTVMAGQERFYLAPPTAANLAAFERWQLAADGSAFADAAPDVGYVDVAVGETLLLPTGWIFGVHASEDTLAAGGYFLHGLNVPLQLQMATMEVVTAAPVARQLPALVAQHWYAAAELLGRLRSPSSSPVSAFERAGLPALVAALAGWRHAVSQEQRLPAGLMDCAEAAADAARAAECASVDALVAALRERVEVAPEAQLALEAHCQRQAVREARLAAAAERLEAARKLSLRLRPAAWRVDCSCGVTVDDGQQMVQCDGCGAWVHTACEGAGSSDGAFQCRKCAPAAPAAPAPRISLVVKPPRPKLVLRLGGASSSPSPVPPPPSLDAEPVPPPPSLDPEPVPPPDGLDADPGFTPPPALTDGDDSPMMALPTPPPPLAPTPPLPEEPEEDDLDALRAGLESASVRYGPDSAIACSCAGGARIGPIGAADLVAVIAAAPVVGAAPVAQAAPVAGAAAAAAKKKAATKKRPAAGGAGAAAAPKPKRKANSVRARLKKRLRMR